ncbi:MAG: 2-keto-4-pentenoate hydratase [Vicinamibacterales bacterium]
MAASVAAMADEIVAAYAARTPIPAFTGREGGLDLATAYAVEAELSGRRRAAGRRRVGVKAGYANKAVWRALKLDTLAWASMYDDTVTMASGYEATLVVRRMIAPRIEPEIVVKLATGLPAGLTEPVEVLQHVEWIALGFEVIDPPYVDGTFLPPDFVAAYGLHAALVVGEPYRPAPDALAALANQLASFTVTLARGDEVVAQGGAKQVLRSPALCLAELASARERAGQPPVRAEDLVSTGTTTESQPIGPGERWTARVEGLPVSPITITLS